MKITNPFSTKREREFFEAASKAPLAPVSASTIDKNIESLFKKQMYQGVIGVAIGLVFRAALKYKWPKYF